MILTMIFSIRPMTAKLTDYSNSQYIPITDGNVIIWGDFDYLRHTTNLTLYSGIADETETLTGHFPLSHMVKLLNSDIMRIRTLLTTLEVHHRHARSVNVIGTALKIIAGTPDFDDFEGLKFNQQEIMNTINGQISINRKTQEQINKLTETVNKIISITNPKQIKTDHLYEKLLARNRIIINEIEILMLSVTLAKVGVINPILLDSEDLKNVIKIGPINTTITDILDNKQFHFIIKYPKPNLECKKIIIFPVQHNGTTLPDDNVADCGNHMLAIGNCSATLISSLCQELSETTCARQLHSGIEAHCSTRPSHLEPLVIIDDGVIILNENTAVINNTQGSVTTVSGTFLITFEDEVIINGTTYRNQRGIIMKNPTSASTAILNITGHQDILSLPYLQRLNIENLQYINDVKKRTMVGPAISGLATSILFLGLFMFLKLRQKRAVQHIDIEAVIESYKRSEDGPHLSGGGVNTVSVAPP